MGLFSRSKSPKVEKVRPPIIPAYEPFDWKKFFTKKRYIPWWILLIIIIVITVLISVYHEEIVKWLTPVSQKIRSLSWGWIIPILILFIISFPPLFGHEIVAILCGIVYGLWIGFAIVAAGTFIGEIGTYFAFKGFLRGRAEKEERRNLNYACLATVTREGGIIFVFIARLSAIPAHLTTAVFATCGISFWVFFIATLLSLPKQLVVVYLGVIINNPSGGHLVSNIILGITFAITIVAAGYIYWQMRKVRPRLIAEHEAIKNGQTSYEGANISSGEIEMNDPHKNNGNGMRDEEAGSPLMYHHGGYQGIQQYQGLDQATGTTEGRFEPLRVQAAGPEPYNGYGDGGYGYEGRHQVYSGPYNDIRDSRNPSASELASGRPIAGRELV
ncbi:Tlg2-vesicle protein [Orbilia oligospora]|uniref:Golgi apparatus membrane protein TVP38 n=1 Tax=Orbilia oligospora TaxID=2813651 RepID=A0A7C8NLD6_ORBOL|nr:Tlg2-vesicle protein [Orbilia oligospora]KAF3096277.1 Tlg2-vesicle protein [Orbilia oligospora]KAF3096278.1 Tlg2-vesicle protein, variant 2 [Orbilia oligospora]KAF3097958.1 Tlg2-vesicle protein [Orbilia oligospora]KAF3097959.1 Tlg2-vesicle protein, variant 2 [Orbilia oligospora]